MQNKKAESGDGKLTPAYRAIVAESDRLEMKDKAVLILAELLLTADILKDLKAHRALFLSVSIGIVYLYSDGVQHCVGLVSVHL